MADRTTQYDSPYEKEEALHAEEVAQQVALNEAIAAEARGQEEVVIEAQAAADEGTATPEQQTLLMQMGDIAYGTKVTDASGKETTLTPVQIQEITTAAGDEKFNAMVKANLIPQGSVYINEQSYIPASQVEQIKATNPELGNILATQGYTAYLKAVEQANMTQAEQLAAFEVALKNAPAELQDAYETGGMAGYSEAVDAYQRVEHPNPYPFGTGVVKLADSQAISQADWNNLAPKYQDIGMKSGYAPMVAEMRTDQSKLTPEQFIEQSQSYVTNALIDKFKAEDKTNQALIIEEAYRRQEAPGGFTYDFDNLPEEAQSHVLSYYSTVKPQSILGYDLPIGAVPQWNRSVEGLKAIAGMVPVLGTIVYWNNPDFKVGNVTIPQNVQRATSILLDATFLPSFFKPGILSRAIAGLAKGKELAEADRIFNDGLKTAISTAKYIDKDLVDPLKAMANAQKVYGDNLVTIADLERTLSRGAGDVAPELERVLAEAKGQTAILRQNLMDAAGNFEKAQVAAAFNQGKYVQAGSRTDAGELFESAAKRVGFDMPPASGEFANSIVRDTEQIVNRAFNEVKSVKATQTEIQGLLEELLDVKTDAARISTNIEGLNRLKPTAETQKAVYDNMSALKAVQVRNAGILKDLSEAQSRILIARSGEAARLHGELGTVRNALDNARAKLNNILMSEATHGNVETDYASMIYQQRAEIKRLTTLEARYENKLARAIKNMEMSWSEPYTRGGGNILTRNVPTVTPKYTGGGVKSPPGEMRLITYPFRAGAGMGFMAGEGSVVIPAPTPLPKTPDIFIFTPGQPYNPDTMQSVTVAPPKVVPVKPETEPTTKPKVWPIHAPIPEQEPFQTVHILQALQATPATLTSAEPQPSTEPQTQAERAAKTISEVAIGTKTGDAPFTGQEISPIIKIQPETSPQNVVLPATQTQVETRTETFPKPTELTKITPKLGIKITTKPPIRSSSPKTSVLSRLESDSPMSQPVEQGSIAWVQGSLKGIRGVETARWWYKPPPYDKEPIPLSAPPMGAKWNGSLDPQETIQIIGTSRAAVPNRVYAKLGFENITIINGREIEFDKATIDGTNSKMVDLNLDSVPEFAINKPVNRTEFGNKAKRIGKNKAADKGNNYVTLRGVRR